MDSPDFETLNSLAWPYGKILYYMFTFIVTSLLLNILIALFGSAYNRVYDNATDEYLTLQAEKLYVLFVPQTHMSMFLLSTLLSFALFHSRAASVSANIKR